MGPLGRESSSSVQKYLLFTPSFTADFATILGRKQSANRLLACYRYIAARVLSALLARRWRGHDAQTHADVLERSRRARLYARTPPTSCNLNSDTRRLPCSREEATAAELLGVLDRVVQNWSLFQAQIADHECNSMVTRLIVMRGVHRLTVFAGSLATAEQSMLRALAPRIPAAGAPRLCGVAGSTPAGGTGGAIFGAAGKYCPSLKNGCLRHGTPAFSTVGSTRHRCR